LIVFNKRAHSFSVVLNCAVHVVLDGWHVRLIYLCCSLFTALKMYVCSFVFLCYRAFDAELLYIAQKLKIPISEVAVNWTEIEGNYVKHV